MIAIRRLGFVLAFLALFGVAGGHWAVLQSVAWAGMVVEYAQKDGLREGLGKTFDGDHPCDLCAKVSLAKQSEEKKEKAPSEALAKKKTEPFATSLAVAAPRSLSVSVNWPRAALAAAARSDRPPVPPPPSLLS